MNGVKCPDCRNCSYYESVISYGTEEIRCANTDCPLYTIREEESEEEEE